MDDYALALDEIKAAGPGGNHLASKYTRKHHREFWMPELLDHSVHDRWAADGATTLKERIRARLVALRGAARPFELSSEQTERLEAMLADALRDQDARV